MATHENAPPPPGWASDSRPNPFDVTETPQHRVFVRGCDVELDAVPLADAKLDALGTE